MRIAMGVEYEGTKYHGFQSQTNVMSIQALLEKAISQVADHAVKIYCAGRTDKGVHAVGQVIHFDTEVERTKRAWLLGTNTALPADVSIQWIKIVKESFHARFSATKRRYHYWILTTPVRSALLRRHVAWYHYPLDQVAMEKAVTFLVGEHDFSAFRGAGCQASLPIRYVNEAKLSFISPYVVLNISANGFLYHMVRNIMGVLLEVGRGQAVREVIQELLQKKKRHIKYVMAPAKGLYLADIEYPEEFSIPHNTMHYSELMGVSSDELV